MKGAISFWPTLMVPLEITGWVAAAVVGKGVEVGTEVADGADVAAGSAVAPGTEGAPGTDVGTGAEVAAGAVVGRGVAVADDPQARMKSSDRIAEVNINVLSRFGQQLRIIGPLRFKVV